MIGVPFDPASLAGNDRVWWDVWTVRAEVATWKAIEAFEVWLQRPGELPFKYEGFSQPIWKELKDWYRTGIFPNKCAYCESKFSRYPGDAEHYRPKSAVKSKGKTSKLTDAFCDIPDPVNGGSRRIKHPGYFWLAYDWRNLIPACTLCNSGKGKNERFEIDGSFVILQKLTQQEFDAIPASHKPRRSPKWPEYFYPSSPMLDKMELPVLLNPLNPTDVRNPRKHLRFGVRGVIAAIDGSEPGTVSIDMLQLEESLLQEERQIAQEEFQERYFDILRRAQIDKWQQAVKPLVEPYTAGAKPFSAAALDYLQMIRDRFSKV